jgi:hypothetical protein
MRYALIVVMLPLFAGCADTPTEADSPRETVLAGAITDAEDADRVTIRMASQPEGGGEIVRQFELLVEHLQDGVAVEMLEPTPSPAPALIRNGPEPRAPAVGGSLTLSGGARLHDANGSPVTLTEFLPAERRAEFGFPPRSGPAPRTGSAGGQPVPRLPRGGRVVTPDQATKNVSDLRARVGAEERVGTQSLRFRRVTDGATETWLFDEEIGAVVERVIVRADRPRVTIRNEYSATVDGHELVRTVTEWTEVDGRPARRLEIDYTGGRP